VDEVTRLIMEKLLLGPTEQLKALGDSETVGLYAEALTRLFKLASGNSGEAQPDEVRTVTEEEDSSGTPAARVEPFPHPSARSGRRPR
jgi:hypothetical protein